MKAMRAAMISQGFVDMTPVKPVQTKYRVFHIPTSSFLCQYNSSSRQWEPAIFTNKAKAGHGRNDYMSQIYKSRNYSGFGLILESDIPPIQKSLGRASSPVLFSHYVKQEMKMFGTRSKEEFELIPIDEVE